MPLSLRPTCHKFTNFIIFCFVTGIKRVRIALITRFLRFISFLFCFTDNAYTLLHASISLLLWTSSHVGFNSTKHLGTVQDDDSADASDDLLPHSCIQYSMGSLAWCNNVRGGSLSGAWRHYRLVKGWPIARGGIAVDGSPEDLVCRWRRHCTWRRDSCQSLANHSWRYCNAWPP